MAADYTHFDSSSTCASEVCHDAHSGHNDALDFPTLKDRL
ncbi:hypothetical protein C4K40_5423 [Pseudomonas sp. CMR5c]|nr:hypothetical protein C4K40_5423 [Pseudomonas sp. CMR5c]